MVQVHWCSQWLLFILIQIADGHTHHTTSAGVHCKKCPPGTHWLRDCTSDGQQDMCEPCPDGYYQSKYNTDYWCAPCDTECPGQHHDPNIVKVAACTRTSNLKCACREGYWMKWHHKKQTCEHVSSCGPGTGVNIPADDHSDTTCAMCHAGSTFSNVSSTTEPCRDCTECGDTEEVVTQCTPVKDTVCRLVERQYDIAEPVADKFVKTEVNASASITCSPSQMALVILALFHLQSL